jgi:hypothetical protein
LGQLLKRTIRVLSVSHLLLTTGGVVPSGSLSEQALHRNKFSETEARKI